MEYMAAHLSKIHGLDWHPDNEFVLATSSQDNSVRVRFTGVPEHSRARKSSALPRGTLERERPEDTSADTLSSLSSVLGLPPAQEVPEHPVLSGSSLEGQVHGEFWRPPGAIYKLVSDQTPHAP